MCHIKYRIENSKKHILKSPSLDAALIMPLKFEAEELEIRETVCEADGIEQAAGIVVCDCSMQPAPGSEGNVCWMADYIYIWKQRLIKQIHHY